MRDPAAGADVFFNETAATFRRDLSPGEIGAFHAKLPGYARTPLVEGPAVAARLGVARFWAKDESRRLGLPAYKILGASWATYRALEQRHGKFSPWNTMEELAVQASRRPRVCLVAATEGNHGRAVARMARWLGLPAHILVPAYTLPARIRLIEEEGAKLTIVNGTYDDAVLAAAKMGDAHHLVISDTAWEGYHDIPQWVMEGYSTLFFEVDAQLAEAGAPPVDIVAVQMGVGALATAVVWRYRGEREPARVIGAEPLRAACLLESARAGRIVEVPGPFDPVMGGLNCGLPSALAWPFVSKGLSAFTAIPTTLAVEAAGELARMGVSSSPSGATGLGGLLALFSGTDAARHRARLGLTANSSVLVLSTEGAVIPAAP